MTRHGTIIRHTILDSDSFGEFDDEKRVLWILMLCEADDWGRLPDNPTKLARRLAVSQKTSEQIATALDDFEIDGCITRYTARLIERGPDGESPGTEIKVIQLTKWEEYQEKLKSRDRSYWPRPDGSYDATTNPYTKTKKASGDVSADIPGDVSGEQTILNPKSLIPNVEKKTKRVVAPKASDAPSRKITDCYQELYFSRFNKKPPWGSKEGKRIRELLESFDGDTDRICQAMRNAFESEDKFLSGNVGSFMTLTAAAVITKADTAGGKEWLVLNYNKPT